MKETSEDYQEIADLVTRHETLELARRDLSEAQMAFEATNEQLRGEFQQYTKQRQVELLAFTNRTATLQAALEDAEKQWQHLEGLAEATRQDASRQSLHLGQIIMSVDNLFQRCEFCSFLFLVMFDFCSISLELPGIITYLAAGMFPSSCRIGGANQSRVSLMIQLTRQIRPESINHQLAGSIIYTIHA